MRILVSCLEWIWRFSTTFHRLVIGTFVVLGIVGFSVMPLIKIGSSLMSGARQDFPLTNWTLEQSEVFGDQDVLTLVVEFPEPPGEERLPIIRDLAKSLESVPGVRSVRWRVADLEDEEGMGLLYKRFLLGMMDKDRRELDEKFSSKGLPESFRRNVNRLWLTSDPDVQRHILKDPSEFRLLVRESYRHRTGSGVVGDSFLLLTSPDSRLFLIRITAEFLHVEASQSHELIERIRTMLSVKVPELVNAAPGLRYVGKEDVKWYLTGTMAFLDESYALFQSGISTILIVSFVLVVGLLVAVYRSVWAGLILFAPIACGVGPNYGLIYLGYDEVNPMMMAATGVLFGLGTDYGVHLWERFVAENDKGVPAIQAVGVVYREIGPPIVIGALTNVLAFLCLCLSYQSGIYQLGYFGASGLFLTLLSTLFLFPAMVKVLSGFKKERYPRMRVTVGSFGHLFAQYPRRVVAISTMIFLVSVVLGFHASHEKDLLKVFIARNMDSQAVAEKINESFRADFSQPVLLTFDVEDMDQGLHIQRRLDDMLGRLIREHQEIASFDSVSHLMSPHSLSTENALFLSSIVARWPDLEATLGHLTGSSVLSLSASGSMTQSFDSTGKLVRECATMQPRRAHEPIGDPGVARYVARVGDKFRFLTRVIYSHRLTDTHVLKKADARIQSALEPLPVKVTLCGGRQFMDEIQSSSISEISRLGLLVLAAVGVFFLVLFRHPMEAILSLIPMVGAFSVTIGAMGALNMGLPMSVVAVAPLIFGLAMDNGVHVVMGSLHEGDRSVTRTMERVTRPIVFTSITNILGFVAMLTSRHYSLEFLGWAMVIGMTAAVGFALITLPAILVLMQERTNRTTLPGSKSPPAGREPA